MDGSVQLPYVREAQLLRAASELLRLPQAVIATALTFLHRFYKACPTAANEPKIASACLFLASKVEEVQVRVNDLVNAFIFLEAPQDVEAISAIFPQLAFDSAAPSKVVVGDAYYAAKDQLIQQEQVVLRWLSFDLCVDHPFRYLLNCANAAGCSSSVVTTALSILNDSLLLTNLSANQKPVYVAAGALSLATAMHHGIVGEPTDVLATCINALGVTRQTTASIVSHMVRVLKATVLAEVDLQTRHSVQKQDM